MRARAGAAQRGACSSSAAQAAPPAPRLRLDPAGFDLIAEVKLRSPAAGCAGAAADEDVRRARRRLCARRRRGRVDSHRAQPLRRLARAPGAARAAHSRRSACRPCARISWSTPTRCSRRALAGAGGVLAILRMLPRADSRRSSTARASEHVRAARGLRRADIELMHELRGARRAARAACWSGSIAAISHAKVVPRRLDELAPLLPRAGAARGRERRRRRPPMRARGGAATTWRWSAAR